jgi:hypothetical protein
VEQGIEGGVGGDTCEGGGGEQAAESGCGVIYWIGAPRWVPLFDEEKVPRTRVSVISRNPVGLFK